MDTHVFKSSLSRRFADPNFNGGTGVPKIERHILFVRALDLPEGLSLDPNARLPKVNKLVYRGILRSLLNDDETVPNTFHLKHKGIVLVARSVNKGDAEGDWKVKFGEGHGILDGGHTYQLLMDNRDAIVEAREAAEADGDADRDQYVKVEILTGVPQAWVVDLSAGLNTSVQVQDMSLENLAGSFQWLKDLLRDEPYYKRIAWREGEDGVIDARELVSLLLCFNIDLFPVSEDMHPIMAYEKKKVALDLFKDRPETFEKLKPIVKDILTLHDTIRRDAREKYNRATKGKAGGMKFIQSKSPKAYKQYEFVFTGKTSKFRLMNGALYPMLAAFRWMVEECDGQIRWRKAFVDVLRLWESTAAELMTATQQTSQDLGRNPNAIGKSRGHWANLFRAVQVRDLMAQAKLPVI